MSRQMFRTATLIGLAMALSACASTFSSNVTSFHTQVPPAGVKVAVVPIDENKLDSLEYRQYGSALQAMAERVGFVGAREKTPDYVIGFDVSINDGREKLRSFYNGPSFWQRGYGWGGWWNPGFGPYGSGFNSDIVARTVYRAELHVEIRKPDGTMVFEATAETESRDRSLPELVPLLAEAVFKEFPGENGKMRRVKIDLAD